METEDIIIIITFSCESKPDILTNALECRFSARRNQRKCSWTRYVTIRTGTVILGPHYAVANCVYHFRLRRHAELLFT